LFICFFIAAHYTLLLNVLLYYNASVFRSIYMKEVAVDWLSVAYMLARHPTTTSNT